VKLFGLNASKELAASVAESAGIWLASHEERDFEDGEFKVRSLVSVRGERVFVCQSLTFSNGQSVNDALARAGPLPRLCPQGPPNEAARPRHDALPRTAARGSRG
jgi:hypothetical protein